MNLTSSYDILINTSLKSTSSPSCVYDNLIVEWNTSLHPTSIHFAFTIDNEWDGYSIPLSSSMLLQSSNSTLPLNPLKCDLNEDHCVLNVVQVYLSEKKLSIEFDKPTNQVDLMSTSKLNEVLAIRPSIIGSAIGIWSTPSKLEIIITEEFHQAIVRSYQEGTYSVTLRTYSTQSTPQTSTEISSLLPPNVFVPTSIASRAFISYNGSRGWWGKLPLRPTRPGVYRLFMMDFAAKRVISTIHRTRVNICDQLVTPTRYYRKFENQKEESVPPHALLRYNGVVSISGKENARGITIPNSILPSKGTWSLSMWYYMVEPPNGVFRALFYKGDGIEVHRTPSAWFLPVSNRLALRVTSEDSPDVGSDTTIDLPIHTWVHFTFVFDNSSDDSYKFILYVDGKLDISLTFSNLVLANNHSLNLFKDVAHAGAKGFAAEITIWDSALSGLQVAEISNPSARHQTMIQPISVASELISQKSSHSFENSLVDSNTDEELQSSVFSDQNDCIAKNWYESTGSQLPSVLGYQHLLSDIDNAITNCLPPTTRLDLYAEGSMYGHVESLYKWSMLIGFGSEMPTNPCGIEDYGHLTQQYHRAVYTEHENECLHITSDMISDQVKATLGLVVAAQLGYSAAYIPLSTLFSSSIGLGIFALDFRSRNGRCVLKRALEFIPFPTQAHSSNEDEIFEVVGERYVDLTLPYRLSAFVRKIKSTGKLTSFYGDAFNTPIAVSVLEMDNNKRPMNEVIDQYSLLSTGLLFLAALDDHAEAYMMLSRRYQHQFGGVEKDIEVAALYGQFASKVSSDSFHKIGGQPVLEGDRLTDATEKEVLVGNSGADDEFIQTLTIQANEGDVDSMISLGEINYYGSRGMPRNQPQALDYYNRAAATGSSNGLCGAAGMYLKGEGTEKNVSRAIEMYNQAAKDGSIRALNGLGYIYFFGNGEEAPMNKTKAYHYFLTATEYGGDSDSWFNAGYCLEHGLGVEKDIERAAAFYLTAAQKFGYFDAVVALGNFYLLGTGVVRNPAEALTFFGVANAVGPWAGWLRRGFNQYVQGQSEGSSLDYSRALLSYIYAGEIGYEVSQGNSAFIIRRKLSSSILERMMGLNLLYHLASSEKVTSSIFSNLPEKLLIRQLLLSVHGGNSESAHLLGSHFLQYPSISSNESSSSLPNHSIPIHEFPLNHLSQLYPTRLASALHWYSKSSAMGNAFGSLQCGLIYHFGILNNPPNLPRAERYYQLAIQQYEKINQSNSNHHDRNLRILCDGLLWLIHTSRKYSIVMYLSGMVGWALRWIFFEG